MCNKIKQIRRQCYEYVCDKSGKVVEVVAIGGTAVVTMTQQAHAALPAPATAAFDTLTTNVTDIQTAVWGVLALSVGGFALMKLFKKGANKAI